MMVQGSLSCSVDGIPSHYCSCCSMLGSDGKLIGAAVGAKPMTNLKYDVAQHCTEKALNVLRHHVPCTPCLWCIHMMRHTRAINISLTWISPCRYDRASPGYILSKIILCKILLRLLNTESVSFSYWILQVLSHFLTDPALFLYDQVGACMIVQDHVKYLMVVQDHVKYLIPSYKITSNILYGRARSCQISYIVS